MHFLRSQPLKAGLLFLLGLTSASPAFEDYSGSIKGGVPPARPEPPLVPTRLTTDYYLTLLVEPRHRAPFTGLCGGSWMMPFTGRSRLVPIPPVPPRPSKLADPVPTLGEAYLKCRTITARTLEPRVPLELYPEGHFGDWVHEGVLVMARVEIEDEAGMEQVFTRLAEAVGDSEELEECWAGELSSASGPFMNDYRHLLGFIPDLAVEFVGEVPLSVEISLEQGRMLIRAGDKWDVYSLDRRSARAFKELLAGPGPARPVAEGEKTGR